VLKQPALQDGKRLGAHERDARRKAEAEDWRKRAEERKEKIQKYLWDGEQGLYFDYDFENGKRSTYEYVTAFFPLWRESQRPSRRAR